MKNLSVALLLLLSIGYLTSCQKEIESGEPTDPSDTTSTPSRLDLLRDSVYLYSQEVYFWNKLLPMSNLTHGNIPATMSWQPLPV